MLKIKLADGPLDGEEFVVVKKGFIVPWEILYEGTPDATSGKPKSLIYRHFSEKTINNVKEITYCYDGDQIG